ncbi:hypothetical protein [Pedobacter sp. L105]|uniref:hypothetical protein n=1 Tax=Pedobacter sp. L105 TaxID=1641871 RepID=UPI00131D2191|nr:hypothetical protein [Pedobacter sp. L105]
MNNQSPSVIPNPEFNLLVTYKDPEKVATIDSYYQSLFSSLRLSERLTEEEKEGQRDFLSNEWEERLFPFLSFWSVKIYG